MKTMELEISTGIVENQNRIRASKPERVDLYNIIV